jgi:hypothetical protein
MPPTGEPPWWWYWLPERARPSPFKVTLFCLERDPPGVRLRLNLPATSTYLPSRDGSFVILVECMDASTRLARYDLDGPKPWARIVGVPLGLGLVLLTLYALLRWWRMPR